MIQIAMSKSELEGKNNEYLTCNEGYYIDPTYSKKSVKNRN